MSLLLDRSSPDPTRESPSRGSEPAPVWRVAAALTLLVAGIVAIGVLLADGNLVAASIGIVGLIVIGYCARGALPIPGGTHVRR